MRFHALATDYDGTLASDGAVAPPTDEALRKLLASGRRLVMVTGRELPELMTVCPYLDLFEWIVAENGGLLYQPSTQEEIVLADPPPPEFAQELIRRGVDRLSVGRAIVATWEPFQEIVLDVIREQGLDLQVIFNKGAVMVLPSGVNKASGFAAALERMGLSRHNVAAIGDAENDHALLRQCEFSAAVSNALPSVCETADRVTEGDHGDGVIELCEQIVADDLQTWCGGLARMQLPVGTRDGGEVGLPAYGPSILLAGPSASGKSTVATRFVESLVEQGYQFCLVDPEGDYEAFEGAIVCGGPDARPSLDEVSRLLKSPATSVIVSLTGVAISDRPPLFLELLSMLLQLRTKTGRPHWLILDEAHHLMPAEWAPAEGLLPAKLQNSLLITVHPQLLSPSVLSRMNTMLAMQSDAQATLTAFAERSGNTLPAGPLPAANEGELYIWSADKNAYEVFRPYPSQSVRRRHRRKYADGELPPDRSFYFQGPKQKLNLRAENLSNFVKLAEGVDPATWEYHRKQGDFSKWFRECIKDENLAAVAEQVERAKSMEPDDSRARIRDAIARDYTVDPTSPLPVAGAS